MTTVIPSVKLNNGEMMPIIALGTWQGGDDPSTVSQAVKDAIDAGYRHFDCASIYGNEAVIGKAIREKILEGVVRRDDLFIITKLWNNRHRENLVVPACRKSLESFGLDYVDLYLIHWPLAYKEHIMHPVTGEESYDETVTLEQTWRGMEECYRLGFAKSIGVSNFNSVQIDRILKVAKVKPVVNQVECHPYLNQKKLRDFCASRGMFIMSYSPLSAPKKPWSKPGDPVVVIDSPEVVGMAKKYGKSPSQIVLRYLIDIGTVIIPKSSSKTRIVENFNLCDFKLTPEELALIDKFDCGMRVNTAEGTIDHREYPFAVEF